MNPNYKLCSFNTSFLNDCHDIVLGKFLTDENENPTRRIPKFSEAAALLKKAFILKDHTLTGNQIVKKDNKYVFNDNDCTLRKLRDAAVDKSISYVEDKITKEYDFISLIEQTIHVSKNPDPNYDHAYYSLYNNNDNDIEVFKIDDPEKYGIMKRLNALKESVENVSVENGSNKPYYCVFDNVISTSFHAGEGIAIIFKKDLVTDGLVSWNLNDLLKDEFSNNKKVVKDKYGKKNFIDENDNKEKKYNYYSMDMGIDFTKNNNNYFKAVNKDNNVVADLGRPFIMAAGKKDNTLNIMVSLHGVNLVNILTWRYPNNKNNYETKKPFNFTEKDSDEYNNMVKGVVTNIQLIINNALKMSSIEGEDHEKIQLFFGCDSNDAHGLLPKIMKETEFNILDKPIYFPNYGELPNTCCANCNSTYEQKDKDINKSNVGEGNCGNKNIDTESLQEVLYGETKKNGETEGKPTYQNNFHSPENFAFKGDYVLFGSSDNNIVENMNGHILADRDNKHIMFDTEVESGAFNNLLISDHLPVFMELKNATDSAVLNKNSNEQKNLVLNDFIISVKDIKKYAPEIIDNDGNIISDKEYINKMSDYINIIIDRDYKDLNHRAKENLKNLYHNMNSIKMKKEKNNDEAIERTKKNNSIKNYLKAINKAINSKKQGGKRRTRRRSRRSRRSTHRKKKMSRRKRNTRKRR